MKANKAIAIYRRMRKQPLWRLLAASNGPTIIGLLQAYFYENERGLPASIFYERLSRDLEELRAQGEDFPQTAQAYAASWLAEGYLKRSFAAGATEEAYELSTAALEAIRFVSGLNQPHVAATESRLALVMAALIRLADDTDTDKFRRIDRLMAEQARIDQEIDAIHKGQMRVLPQAVALERAREIIALADELASDFRRVRDQFEQLNRELREQIMNNEGNRGEVLDSLFAGVDLITESEAGRTFAAFWRLLTDPEQMATLDQALESLLARDFMAELGIKERQFLLRLTKILLEQGGRVHEVLHTFARSLKHFVQSREYLEQRRLNQLLKEAQRTALSLKEAVRVTELLPYAIDLPSVRPRSLSQWVLYDPALQALPEQMQVGETAAIDLTMIGDLIAQSEIDFRTLKANVCAVLVQKSQASIAEVLAEFPATQGLGSVIGLLALASRHGFKVEQTETVAWTGNDGQQRSAKIPKIFFLQERSNEWV